MGRQQGERQVRRAANGRFVIKVQTNRELLATECMVKVKNNRVSFVFDKYNSSNPLSLVMDNLNGQLDWKGIVKKIKGEFGIFIIKKKVKGKWGNLYAIQQEEDLTVSDIGEKVQTVLLSEEEPVPLMEEPAQSKGNSRNQKEYGELTSELVEAMYDNKKVANKMTRRKSRAKSLVKNFKNIMSRYGNQSRKQLSRKDRSNFGSNRPQGERTVSEMESFLQAENQASSEGSPNIGTIPKSKFGFKSSDQLEKNKSRSVSRSRTGNLRLSQMNGHPSGRKNKEEAKTGLISEKRETNKKANMKVRDKMGDFKVLTIEDIMRREKTSPFRVGKNGNKNGRDKPKLKLMSEINSDPYLNVSKNPFIREDQGNPGERSRSRVTPEEVHLLESQLKKHKEKFLSSKNLFGKNRKSIYHQQMSKNYIDNLKKSRKSIRSIDALTNAYRRITQKRAKKIENRKLENSPSILEELEIEFSNEQPLIQNSSVVQSNPNNNLPIKSHVASKSHRNVRARKGIQRVNKSNPKLRNGVRRQIRNIENTFKTKSVPKKNVIRSLSKPYTNKKNPKKGSSIVFTKPRNNKKKVQRKVTSKSAVHNRKRSHLTKNKPEMKSNATEDLQKIYGMVSGKKQEILDTFAGLSLDMGWVHKQCRHMDLESSEGVVGFLELQNRLIIKLATKLRKEKNSRYKVEQQCQNMFEKLSHKLK